MESMVGSIRFHFFPPEVQAASSIIIWFMLLGTEEETTSGEGMCSLRILEK